jgi:DNA-binding transcriptional regulator YhcF (GntR family)
MLLEVDFGSEEPIYRQIRTQIVHGVATGELQPGDALPSVRTLASNLSVNMHTVNKAYAVLRDEGYVVMHGRSGAYIADAARLASPTRAREQEAQIVSDLQRIAIEYRARGGSFDEFVALATLQAKLVFSPKKGSDSK